MAGHVRPRGRPSREGRGPSVPSLPTGSTGVYQVHSIVGRTALRPPCPETHPCRVGWENGVSSLRCFGQCPSFLGSSFITTNDTTQSQRPENWTRWELHILLHHSCIHLISGRASLLVPRETWIVQLLSSQMQTRSPLRHRCARLQSLPGPSFRHV